MYDNNRGKIFTPVTPCLSIINYLDPKGHGVKWTLYGRRGKDILKILVGSG